MTLYFRNSHGKIRKIGKIDGRMRAQKVIDEISRQIKAFCDERNFTIYYTRVWNEDLKEKPATKYDVGSHTEFFYVCPPVYHLYEKVRKENGET